MKEKIQIDECTLKANMEVALEILRKELATGNYGVDPSHLSKEAYAQWEKTVKLALEEEVKRHRDVRPQT